MKTGWKARMSLVAIAFCFFTATVERAQAQATNYEYDHSQGGWVDTNANLVWGYDISNVVGVLNFSFAGAENAVASYADQLDLGRQDYFNFTGDAATDTLTLTKWANGSPVAITDHHLRNDQLVTLVEGSSHGWSLPGGLVDGGEYYVIVVNSTQIKLAPTPGGSAIDLTDDGVGYNYFNYQKNFPVEAEIARQFTNWRQPTIEEIEAAYYNGLFSDENLAYGPVYPEDYSEIRFDIWRWTSSVAHGTKHYRFRVLTGEVELVDANNFLYMGLPVVVRSLDGSSGTSTGGHGKSGK